MKKCVIFKDIFPGLSRSWNFQEKIQDFPGGMVTLNISFKNTENVLLRVLLGSMFVVYLASNQPKCNSKTNATIPLQSGFLHFSDKKFQYSSRTYVYRQNDFPGPPRSQPMFKSNNRQ